MNIIRRAHFTEAPDDTQAGKAGAHGRRGANSDAMGTQKEVFAGSCVSMSDCVLVNGWHDEYYGGEEAADD